MRYVYSLVRFVPDPARGEFINVGAIVGSEEASEWQMRQIENPRRARLIDERGTLNTVWEFLDDVGRDIDSYEEALGTLLDPPVELSEAWLKQLSIDHKNMVQITTPTPMLASDAEEALDLVFEELILDPARHYREAASKHYALAAVRRSYREHHIGKDNLQQRVILQTQHHHRERVDFAVTNGQVVQLTHTWSFEVKDQEALAGQVKAWGWTIRDAKETGGEIITSASKAPLELAPDVDVRVIYAGSKPEKSSPALEDALNVFESLDVRLMPLDEADRVGQKANELLAQGAAG